MTRQEINLEAEILLETIGQLDDRHPLDVIGHEHDLYAAAHWAKRTLEFNSDTRAATGLALATKRYNQWKEQA